MCLQSAAASLKSDLTFDICALKDMRITILTVRLFPGVAVWTALVLCLCLGLGLFGVQWSALKARQSARDNADQQAEQLADSFRLLLQQVRKLDVSLSKCEYRDS